MLGDVFVAINSQKGDYQTSWIRRFELCTLIGDTTAEIQSPNSFPLLQATSTMKSQEYRPVSVSPEIIAVSVRFDKSRTKAVAVKRDRPGPHRVLPTNRAFIH
jgi:hypothetical protein